MNFLTKTFSTLTGNSIPYTFSEKLIDPNSQISDSNFIWTLYKGSNPKQNNAEVTIFEFNLKDPNNLRNGHEQLARNSFKKAKMIKHPGLVSVLEFIENDNFLYMITEPVIPLKEYLKATGGQLDSDVKLFGIYNIGKMMQFINMTCNSVHGCVCCEGSVFINRSDEWKLFGFELLTNYTSDPDQSIYKNSGRYPGFNSILPEDVLKNGIDSIKRFPIKFDSYLYALFIYKVYLNSNVDKHLNSSEMGSNLSVIPRGLQTSFKKLINPNPNVRITIERFMAEQDKLFSSNKLIKFNTELDELKFMDETAKTEFLKYRLRDYIPDNTEEINFPAGILEKKLVPVLVNCYSTLSVKKSSGGDAIQNQEREELLSPILHHILRIGFILSDEHFDKWIKPIILLAFGSMDRSIRLNLLTHLPTYVDRLTPSDIQQRLFYNLIAGFQDTNYMIREATLKSMYTIVDKISEKQVNQDLLKILAKSQMDVKPSIRTNTLVIIIKVSGKIYKNSRNNVLITALGKALRDSFVPCKMTALSGFEQLINSFTFEDICGKILGHLAIALMDPKSSKVRKEAKRVFDLYLKKVEDQALSLPQDDEDDDLEEIEFYKTHCASDGELKRQEETASSEGSYFKWNFVNKLISSSAISGELEHSYNVSTPDLSQPDSKSGELQTPLDRGSFETENNWDNEFNLSSDEDEKQTEMFAKPTKAQPNSISRPSTANRQGLASSRKSAPLKLGAKKRAPGSALKLNVQVDDTDEDGWANSEW